MWKRSTRPSLAAPFGCGLEPAYLLTDNERAVSVEWVADLAVRRPAIVTAGRHYGMVTVTVLTTPVAGARFPIGAGSRPRR